MLALMIVGIMKTVKINLRVIVSWLKAKLQNLPRYFHVCTLAMFKNICIMEVRIET